MAALYQTTPTALHHRHLASVVVPAPPAAATPRQKLRLVLYWFVGYRGAHDAPAAAVDGVHVPAVHHGRQYILEHPPPPLAVLLPQQL